MTERVDHILLGPGRMCISTCGDEVFMVFNVIQGKRTNNTAVLSNIYRLHLE